MTYETYQPYVAGPTPTKSKPKGLIIGLGIAVLATCGITAFALVQHSNLSQTEDNLAAVSADLDSTEDDLATTRNDLDKVTTERDDAESDLTITQGDLSTAQHTVGACQDAVKVARLEWKSIDALTDALDTDQSIYLQIDALDRATTNIEAMNRIVDNGGYSSIFDVFDTCAGSNSSDI